MKKFIIRLLLFSVVPLVLIITIYMVFNTVLDDAALGSGIESKIENLKLDNDKINIVIAGGSRAERQLIPKLIESQTGLNTINIAVSGGDMVSTLHSIKKNYSNSQILYVISTSFWQVNDGAIEHGYLSLQGFQELTYIEKYSMLRNNIPEFFFLYKELAVTSVKYTLEKYDLYETSKKYDQEILDNLGFMGVEGSFSKLSSRDEVDKFLNKHPWYKNLYIDGARWRIFKESIQELNNINSHFILILPPVSPYWKDLTRGSKIDLAEKEYAQKLKELSYQFDNIDVYDFYAEPIEELEDSMFYDYHHLNKSGARLFSDSIAKIIKESVEVRSLKPRSTE